MPPRNDAKRLSVIANKAKQSTRPPRAIHCLNGSALGEGMDWIIRKSCSVSATSVGLFLPSSALILNFPIFSESWLPSCNNFVFKSLQYLLGRSDSVNTATTSTIEKYHFSSVSSHTVRTFFSSNNRKACCCVISLLLLFDAVKIGNYLICGTTFARKKFRENKKNPIN